MNDPNAFHEHYHNKTIGKMAAVLFNGVGKEGTNINQANTLVLTYLPKSETETDQLIGRILRLSAGKKSMRVQFLLPTTNDFASAEDQFRRAIVLRHTLGRIAAYRASEPETRVTKSQYQKVRDEIINAAFNEKARNPKTKASVLSKTIWKIVAHHATELSSKWLTLTVKDLTRLVNDEFRDWPAWKRKKLYRQWKASQGEWERMYELYKREVVA